LDQALDAGFLALFDTLFEALVIVLTAFDVESCLGEGLVAFLAGFLFGIFLHNIKKPNR